MPDGEAILETLRRLRKMHEDIALLLRTACSQMEPQGWEPINNTATCYGSNSIHVPQGWMPVEAFRLMTHPAKPNLLAFVGVLLDHLEEPHLLTEPLVTAGWLDYGKNGPVGVNYHYWYCRVHLWMPGRKDDGALLTALHDQAWPDWKQEWHSATSLALPLTAVSDADVLFARVVQPLLKSLTKTCECLA